MEKAPRLRPLLGSALALSLFPALAPPASAGETLAPGFAGASTTIGFGVFVSTLSDGTFVAFDGTDVTLHGPTGALLSTLATLGSPGFASFVRVSPDETFAVVGESSFGNLYRVPLNAGPGVGATFVATLELNYDAAFASDDVLYVSAARDADPDADVYRLQLSSGGFAKVAGLDGASGPLEVDDLGNLYYGTSDFPLPPGGSTVYRFTAAQLVSGTTLGEGDATVVGTGFPGASAMAFDSLRDDLYLAASDFGTGVNRVYRVEGNESASPRIVEGDPGGFLFDLEFASAGSGPAAFRAFQPEGGGTLRYSSADLHVAVTAERPDVVLSGPGLSGPGALDLTLSEGAPGGTAYTLYGPAALVPANELAVFLGARGLNVFLGLDLGTLCFDPAPFALDADGLGGKGYVNPGGLEGLLALQVLVLDSSGRIAGTSSVGFN